MFKPHSLNPFSNHMCPWSRKSSNESVACSSEVLNIFHFQDIWWLISITLIFFWNENLLVTRLSDRYLACSGTHSLKLMCGRMKFLKSPLLRIFVGALTCTSSVGAKWSDGLHWLQSICVFLSLCLVGASSGATFQSIIWTILRLKWAKIW